MRLAFKYNDGGRSLAGYKGNTGDCVVRAIAIAAQLPYAKVYNDLATLNEAKGYKRSARYGTGRNVYENYLKSLGWVWVPTMRIGQGCKVHLRKSDLPDGRLIVRVSKHMVAVINGEIHDSNDCSRNGTRCVYGYFVKGQ